MADFKVSTSDIPNINISTDIINDQQDHAVPEYLTAAEIKDPNAIVVQIAIQSPLVVLYGAGNSGKTMSLIRLTRYLRNNSYTVEPIRDFRPTNSVYYQKCCDDFLKNVNSNTAAGSNEQLSFMLLNITQGGERMCQILEAPGEHYFSKGSPKQEYPTYVLSIINNELPKIWVFILELDWEDQTVRDQYANKIVRLFGRIKRTDEIILLCNKADMKPEYYHNDKPVERQFERDCREQYQAIFNTLDGRRRWRIFSNDSRPYEFTVFSAGSFTTRQNSDKTFIPSKDYNPEKFWKKIKKGIKGGWF